MKRTVFNVGKEYYNFKPEPTVSNEMIAPQVNDYIVPALAEQFQIILDELGKLSTLPKKIKDIYTIPTIKEAFRRMDVLYTDRFGITVQNIPTEVSTLAACIPIKPEGFSQLQNGNTNEFIKEIEETISEEIKQIDQKVIDEYACFGNIASIEQMRRSYNSLQDSLKTKDVVFDLNKAKVYNLPKEYKVYMIGDPRDWIEYNLTNMELVAIFLHEMGHIWTHLEYMYRNYMNTTVLIDTFLDNLRNKNRTAKESIILTIKAMNPKSEIDKVKDKNAVTVAIASIKEYYNFLTDTAYTSHYHGFVDSEQLADQFAANFGLGAHIVSGLQKAEKKLMEDFKSISRVSLVSSVITSSLYVYLCVLGTLTTGLAPIVLGSLTFLSLCTLIYTLLIRPLTTNENSKIQSYVEMQKRFERARLDSVRMLRTSDLPKDLVKQLLTDLDSINASMSKLEPVAKFDIVNKLWGTFNANKVEMERIEQVTENLMDNELYVLSNKIKTI